MRLPSGHREAAKRVDEPPLHRQVELRAFSGVVSAGQLLSS